MFCHRFSLNSLLHGKWIDLLSPTYGVSGRILKELSRLKVKAIGYIT